ncbi:hypothetical protein B0H14DRAFT_2580486 [Mycena olivaceomarginata]|nr:hypothetical protein B0H14DRAFT_2580486 [Mycena olivaceomarginata]
MSLYDYMLSESSTLEQPWFSIDAETGHTLTGSDIKTRTDALAQGLNRELRLGSSLTACDPNYGIREVVGIVTPNSVDFGTIFWACHKLGCTVASINGASTVDELKHQFSLSGTETVFAPREMFGTSYCGGRGLSDSYESHCGHFQRRGICPPETSRGQWNDWFTEIPPLEEELVDSGLDSGSILMTARFDGPKSGPRIEFRIRSVTVTVRFKAQNQIRITY